MNIAWKKSENDKNIFVGYNRESEEEVWTATRFDLIFGANAQLRAITEVYGGIDSKEKFFKDFVKAWNKVMNADRFSKR